MNLLHRPMFWSALFFMGGLTAGYFFSEHKLIILLFFILFVFIFCWFCKNNKVVIIAIIILLCGFFFMLYRQCRYYDPESIVNWNDKESYVVKGEIYEDLADLISENIYLKPIKINKRKVKYGLIQLNKNYLPAEFKNGEVISLKLKLKTPEPARNPGNFSYKNYLKKKNIYSIGYYKYNSNKNYFRRHYYHTHLFKNKLIKFKKKLIYLIDIAVEEPFNEVIKALVLGERGNLPAKWEDDFAKTGASHLLAISGLHVGFIILIFNFILQLLHINEINKNILCTLFMVIYILITGMRASVLRAGLLSIFFLWGPFWGRRADLFNICGLTIIITLIINPYQLFTAGFQLTYLVLFMIIFWADIIKNNVTRIIAVSTAAQLGSIPVTAYYFNLITPVGIITNIWAIPLLAGVVLMAITGLLFGLIHPVFTIVSGILLKYLLLIIQKGIFLMIRLPWGSIEIPTPPVFLVLILYIFLFSIPLILKRYILPIYKLKKKKSLMLISIITLFSILYFSLTPFSNNNLLITFLYVGQGDSILLSTSEEKYILIDGGDSEGSRYVLSYLKSKGIKIINICFITHFDSDHAEGILDILNERQVELLILPEKIPGTLKAEPAAQIIQKAKNKNISIKFAGRGDYLYCHNLVLEILNPEINSEIPGANNNSLVIKINYGKFSALLTGDLEYEGEMLLMEGNYNLNSNILKLGHHGSNSSSSHIFLKKVSPRAAVISVGENNYGHPHREVIKRANNLGIDVYRTDEDGAVTITTDGKKYWIKSFLQKMSG